MKSTNYKFIIILIIGFSITYYIGNIYSKSKIGDEYLSILNSEKSIFNTGISENEIFIAYIMDFNCEYSNNEEIINHLNNLVYEIKTKSMTKEFNVRFMLSTTNTPYTSTSLLSKFNFVDEINSSNRWNSLSVNKYLINRGDVLQSTPQLIIVKRENNIQYHGDDKIYTGINNEAMLFHLKSFKEIIGFSHEELLLNINIYNR